MKSFLKALVVRLLALALTASAAFAQDRVPFRQEELDQMLAPIALYPDSLLSQILMASTYPLEVVHASRWSRANPGLKGQDAVRAVERMDWDPSVKSLTAFPQVLTMMDQKIEWTERLGEAFLAQQADVMDAVQGLRRRADAAGNLRSSEQMRVSRQDDLVYIEQGSPEIVYVPYYNPTVVYGPWWWPAYPPVYWAPPPAYYVGAVYGPGFFWGSGIVISTGFFFGHCDWRRRHVTVVHNHVTVNRTTVINQPGRRVAWEHNPAHRRGVPFRNPEARKRYEHARVTGDARRDAGHKDSMRTERRRDDDRTTVERQRRLEERRSAPPERRGDYRDDRRESTVQPEARRMQPDRSVRPERSMPQGDDRRGERGERRDAPRPQPHGSDSRQTAIAPVFRPDSRPAVAAPTVRAQPRVDSRPGPRQAFEGNRRAETRNDAGHGRQHGPVRQSAPPAPRPSVSGGGHAPRVANGHRQHSMTERVR